MNIYEQVKRLNDEGLHSNVVSITSILLSANEYSAGPDAFGITPEQRCQLTVFYADALFQLKEYRRAEGAYKKALQLRKSITKTKGKVSSTVQSTQDVDIKYQTYLCLLNLKQYQHAINVLESIPWKQRSAKINMAMAKLSHQAGNERAAVTSYKEVLKECPLALEAAHGLLQLGIKGAEVATHMVNGTNSSANMEWLSLFIKANSHIYAKEFEQAANTFRQIDNKAQFRDSVDLMVAQGEALYYNGDHKQALVLLQRAHTLDPLFVKGADVLAAILANENKTKELEHLSTRLITDADHTAESWVAMAYYMFALKKGQRAIYFAQKAGTINPKNVEALLLKGAILIEMKKLPEALVHYREALKIASHRFEAYKGLVQCYMVSQRSREAANVASSACKQLGQTPRVLTLYAHVLAKDPLTLDKAKTLLEKALKQDPMYIQAVYQLADIYSHERNYTKGIEFLRNQLRVHSTCRLNEMLGSFLEKTNEHDEAIKYYSVAVNLEPQNSRVLDGLHRMEQNVENRDGASFEAEVEDIVESDREAEMEDSEVDGVWSDVEFSS